MMKVVKKIKFKQVEIVVSSNQFFKDYSLVIYLKGDLIYSIGNEPYYRNNISKYSDIISILQSLIYMFKNEARLTSKKIISYARNY